MKKYINIEDQRYQYQVVNTVNGHSIEVLVVPNDYIAALTPEVAHTLGVTLPPDFRMAWPHGKVAEAEKELTRLAQLNGWTEVTKIAPSE